MVNPLHRRGDPRECELGVDKGMTKLRLEEKGHRLSGDGADVETSGMWRAMASWCTARRIRSRSIRVGIPTRNPHVTTAIFRAFHKNGISPGEHGDDRGVPSSMSLASVLQETSR